MSSHTDEEVRAAIDKGLQQAMPGLSQDIRDGIAEKAMAELNRPAIHPRCPVMVDGWPAEDSDNAVAYFGVCGHAATNIRVLIPAETVRRDLHQTLLDTPGLLAESHVLVIDGMNHRIADLTRNGPDCIDGGTDG